MKKALSLLLAVVMLCSSFAGLQITSHALSSSGSCGENVYWDFDSATGTLVISGIGAMDEPIIPIYAPWYSYASKIKTAVIEDGVISIGRFAFSDCGNFTGIVIPKSVTEISWQAFYNSHALKDVYYSGSEDDWNKISIGDWNSCLYKATIHYNSTGLNDDEPVVNLDALMGTDPVMYNNELAEVAALLSLKTYDNDQKNADSVEGYLQYKLGFDKANIHSRNYGKDYAFTIATKEYSGDDADEILVVVAQGTTNISEMIKDYISKLDVKNKSFYGGYAPYQVVSAFYSEIVNHDYRNSTNLYSLTKQNKRYKILLTGHSLGGAVADLLAAQLTARRHIGNAIGKSDVFCYTFGAIDAIRVDSPIVDGYKNIHNIYNELDTLSPTQCGRSFIGKNGIFLRNGKFGVIEAFEHEFRTPEQIKNGHTLAEHVNHDMHHYLEAVKLNMVKNSLLRPGNAGALDLVNAYSVVGCPVNVDVYCEGNLVGRVVNNVVDTTLTRINIFVDDDVKFIVYPDDKQYDLKLTAFDDGSMVYYNQYLNKEMPVKTIRNVTLTEGKQMSSQVGGNIAASDITLYVVNEVGNTVAEVSDDGTEKPHEHTFAEKNTTEPTCTEQGFTTYTCACGDIYKDNETAALGHDLQQAVTKATLKKDGAIVTTCARCGLSETEVIAHPKSITLSKDIFSYNKKAQKPKVKVVGSDGKVITSDNYTVTYSKGCKKIGKYKVTVKFKGNYSGTKTLTFSIGPTGTSLKKVSAGKKVFTARWKQNKAVKGYQIQYSTDKNFKKAVKTATIKSNKTIKKTVGKLSAKKTYYVRVRTYTVLKKVTYYSDWSKAVKVKTK